MLESNLNGSPGRKTNKLTSSAVLLTMMTEAYILFHMILLGTGQAFDI